MPFVHRRVHGLSDYEYNGTNESEKGNGGHAAEMYKRRHDLFKVINETKGRYNHEDGGILKN